MNKKYISAGIAAATVLTLAAVAMPAFADTTATAGVSGVANASAHANWQGGPGNGQMRGMRGGMRPAVFGTVASISGTTLTVDQKAFGTSTSATTGTVFTVDASNATVKKDNATSTLSAIATGDTVMVQGTVSGTNVTATTIRDGVVPMMRGPRGNGQGDDQSDDKNGTPPASIITGNGEPVVAGTISAVSGDSITLTTKSNVTYTVDASGAKVVQGNTAISVSNLSVGDNVLVQGTVNGTSVTASSVVDQKAPANGTSTPGRKQGFFGGIGSFFMHLFGF